MIARSTFPSSSVRGSCEGIDLGERESLGVVDDVLLADLRDVGAGGAQLLIELDQTGLLQQVQPTGEVRHVVGQSDRCALAQVGHVGDLLGICTEGLDVDLRHGDQVVDTLFLGPRFLVRHVLEEVGIGVSGFEHLVGVEIAGDLADLDLGVTEQALFFDELQDFGVRNRRSDDAKRCVLVGGVVA